MNDTFRMQVRFWGVRGSIPSPGPLTSTFGGNTSCVEVAVPGVKDAVIFDAGSGIRALGRDLMARGGAASGHLVFTHFHWDHVQGLPFFLPLYRADWTLRFYAACPSVDLQSILDAQMRPPYFPVDIDDTPSRKSYTQVRPDGLSLGPLRIEPFPLRHPQSCAGYRISTAGVVAVYATDTELGDSSCDAILRDRCRGADLLICDAQNTVEEEQARRGWGHSSWRQAAAIAREAGVKALVLFHHDPERSDAEIDAIVRAAQELFPNTAGAREGDTITL